MLPLIYFNEFKCCIHELKADSLAARVVELEAELLARTEAEAEEDRFASPVRPSYEINPARFRAISAELQERKDELIALAAEKIALRDELLRQHEIALRVSLNLLSTYRYIISCECFSQLDLLPR